MITDYLKTYLVDLGISLDSDQISKLERYASLLKEWNEKINLTAITDDEGIAAKHFLDSIALVKYCGIENGSRVADVGTGAGFPGMVLKIVRPDIDLTLIDSLQKRLTFLDAVSKELGIKVRTVHARAEDAGHDGNLREKFDFVTARAVASLPVLSEYCLPLCRVGGVFAPMKTADVEAELKLASSAIEILGGTSENFVTYDLPVAGKRGIAFITKVKQTPDKYPRQRVKISDKPL